MHLQRCSTSRYTLLLQLKWFPPNETGGEDDITYTLAMMPPPTGWEGPVTPEGYAQVRSCRHTLPSDQQHITCCSPSHLRDPASADVQK